MIRKVGSNKSALLGEFHASKVPLFLASTLPFFHAVGNTIILSRLFHATLWLDTGKGLTPDLLYVMFSCGFVRRDIKMGTGLWARTSN